MALEDYAYGTQEDQPTRWIPEIRWEDLIDGLGRDRNKDRKKDDGKPGKDTDGNPVLPTGGGSAKAILESFLTQYGLGELGTWAWEQWKNGDSMQEIWLKMRSHPIYTQRFPGMDALAQKGRAISETQYVQYEYAVANLSKRYGIPDGVYNSREAVAQLLGNDLSPVEIEQNMRRAAGVVYGSPAIREAFARFYGVEGDGAAIAYFLDPDAVQPELEKRYAATVVGGSALSQGLDVSRSTAEQIATLVQPSEQQAQQAAFRAGNDSALYAELIGERADVTDDEGLLAAFGADAAAQQAVDRRRSERQASYSGGGGVAANARGVSGLASAAQ
jgi:hypothetical protein